MQILIETEIETVKLIKVFGERIELHQGESGPYLDQHWMTSKI